MQGLNEERHRYLFVGLAKCCMIGFPVCFNGITVCQLSN